MSWCAINELALIRKSDRLYPTERSMENLPKIPQTAPEAAPRFYTPNIDGEWSPSPGARRMSKARFGIRARIWRKVWFRWLMEHRWSWLIPLLLNVVAFLCVLSFELWGIVLACVICLLAEIFLLVFLFRNMVFCLKNQFSEDSKMRLRDLGYSPKAVYILGIIGGVCVGLGMETGGVLLWGGLLLMFLVVVPIHFLMYYKEGTPGPNAYGPAPDDAPTEGELADKNK